MVKYRKSALHALAIAAFAVGLLACGAQPTAAPVATTVPPAAATNAPAAATSAPAATTAPAAAATAALPKAVGKFTYWGGLIFSDDANNAQVARIKAWGAARGVDVDVVMINQNETVQRVSAAIEAGTMPDALDMGRDLVLLLSQTKKLEPLADVYASVGKAHGGWLPPTDAATNPKDFNGNIYGVPFGTGGNVLNRRDDLLSAAGFKDAPATWEELAKMAAAAQKPPKVYGMAFALSNVGDGNITTTWMQAWGGRVADDAGKKCTIDSPETRTFLTWVKANWDAGVFPPGNTTWDGAGDNNAYQAGQAVFIANPGSVYLNILKNDPELAKGSKYSALPKGPKLRVAEQSGQYRTIPTSSKNKELAKDLIAYLADDTFMSSYMANAIYGPVLTSQKDFPIFKSSPLHAGLLDLALNGTPPGWPDVSNAAYAEYQTNFLTPKMVQKVVVDKKSIDDAIKETMTACQAIYDKYK